MTLPNGIRRQTAVLLILAGVSAPAAAASGQPWDWMVSPYIWAAGVSTDIETRVPPNSVEVDTEFEDVIDKLDGAFEVHVEGRGDHVGVMLDFTYLGLAGEKDRRFLRTETDLDTRLLDAAVTWAPGDKRGEGLDFIAGVRYIDVDLTVDFDPYNQAIPTTSLDLGDGYTDFLVGARYTWPLSEKWSLTARGDFSTGESEGTWSTNLVAQYRTGNGAWIFGYRYLDISMDSFQGASDLMVSGVMVGYGFRF